VRDTLASPQQGTVEHSKSENKLNLEVPLGVPNDSPYGIEQVGKKLKLQFIGSPLGKASEEYSRPLGRGTVFNLGQLTNSHSPMKTTERGLQWKLNQNSPQMQSGKWT